MPEVALTRFSHGAGCACKLSAGELETILEGTRGHPATIHPDLRVGLATSDDGGVYDLGDGRSLVQTVDIFTPVVDDPFDWGRIAAANALSDLYAMGATPLTALQYLAWPRGVLDWAVARVVIEAGLEVMHAAGCTVLGGHSIDSPEPAYGFALTGLVASDRVLTNSAAVPGDTLILTKPLGIGIITTAIKRGACPEGLAREAVETMARLNSTASEQALALGAHAATDVTGFGLLGHLRELCRASDVGAVVEARSVPILEGAVDLLGQGMWAGGSERNLRDTLPDVSTALALDDIKPLFDAQTSGGLLVSLPAGAAGDYVAGVSSSSVIGAVTGSGRIEVV
jgi:selenide,water dikinase